MLAARARQTRTSVIFDPIEHTHSLARPRRMSEDAYSVERAARSFLRSNAPSVDHVGKALEPFSPERAFDPSHPQIREDIVRMVYQYLQQEGFAATAMTLRDESSVRLRLEQTRQTQYSRLKRAILAGDWDQVRARATAIAHQPSPRARCLCTGRSPQARALATEDLFRRHLSSCLYAMAVQEYLELIDAREHTRALAVLRRSLKPLEAFSRAHSGMGLQELSYLLGCSVRAGSAARPREPLTSLRAAARGDRVSGTRRRSGTGQERRRSGPSPRAPRAPPHPSHPRALAARAWSSTSTPPPSWARRRPTRPSPLKRAAAHRCSTPRHRRGRRPAPAATAPRPPSRRTA